ncbi:PREDICTED: uncharacterized protein LOC106814506 [Priapulus caudatus]|uniref:Uncharacterized protein LOC106814506 n=1 Tax=Priapulus caudatus TaxID=37621 RepID=A0ABM1EQ31_PRICU|nr:PREDICTED: uncharacterized protein LOC106814506 [Priapulus caudatus]
MPISCGVVNCRNRYPKKAHSFFRLPIVITKQGEVTKEMSDRRRRCWLAAINRTGMSETVIRNLRVCSAHFISGKPSALYKDTDPDWVPMVNMGYAMKDLNTQVVRHDRLKKRKETIKKRDAAMSLVELGSFSDISGGDAEVYIDVDSKLTDLELAQLEISRLSGKLQQADTEIARLQNDNLKLIEEKESLTSAVHKMKATMPGDFANDDDKVQYYTGLKNFVTLMALFNLLSSEISEAKNSSLSKFQKMMITLMRLRLNLSIVDLSYRFGVSRSTISKVFLEIINVMNKILSPFVQWPDRDDVEHVIGTHRTVRQNFSILGATCPIDYLITKSEDESPILDKMVTVCCALTNLCPSVVSFD